MSELAYHFQLIRHDFQDAVETFVWNSRRTRLALKTAAACAMAVAITNLLVIPHSYWAGISTIIMIQPDVASTLRKGWMRAGGAAAGCLLSLLMTALTVQNPLLFTLATFLVITAAFYLGIRSRYGYFWSYMLGHVALISMISVMNPYDTFPIHIAFFRAASVTIGVLCALLFNVILWPDPPRSADHAMDAVPSATDANDMMEVRLFRFSASAHIPTLKHAVKGGLGILMVFWMWLWFEIPGGGLNMSVAIITVLQRDMIETRHKGILRVLGCLLGAALGLFALHFAVESIGGVIATILIVVFPLAYLWSCKPGVAYIGAQSAIAFLVAFAQDAGPGLSLAPAIERLTGITLGVLSIWFLNEILWPKNDSRKTETHADG